MAVSGSREGWRCEALSTRIGVSLPGVSRHKGGTNVGTGNQRQHLRTEVCGWRQAQGPHVRPAALGMEPSSRCPQAGASEGSEADRETRMGFSGWNGEQDTVRWLCTRSPASEGVPVRCPEKVRNALGLQGKGRLCDEVSQPIDRVDPWLKDESAATTVTPAAANSRTTPR